MSPEEAVTMCRQQQLILLLLACNGEKTEVSLCYNKHLKTEEEELVLSPVLLCESHDLDLTQDFITSLCQEFWRYVSQDSKHVCKNCSHCSLIVWEVYCGLESLRAGRRTVVKCDFMYYVCYYFKICLAQF